MARFAVMLRTLALALLGLLVALAGPAWAQSAAPSSSGGEPRLALVIGNSKYAQSPLKNAANDARMISRTLRRLGFEVIERIDTGKKAMEDAILEFGEKLKSGGVGMFYYAGHGVQVRGHNYLIPIDAALPSEASVRVQAVDVDLVLEQMSEARNRANVVVLDACRNNPFLAARRGGGKGLAAVDAARGTLIAYSTAPGTVAADGDGANSPYTASLVRAIEQPGLPVEDIFKRVRAAVLEQTQGGQTPWESSSLTGDLVINLNVTINPPAPAAAPAPAPARDPQAAEIAFWETMGRSNNAADYEDYLKRFPNGTFSGLAKRRVADLKKPAAPPPAPAPAVAQQPAPPPPAPVPVAQAPQAPPSPYAQSAAAPAAAPAAAADPAVRQRSYERIITVLLGQTVGSGTDQGKRNDYRAAPKPKAIAACVDWSGSRPDDLRIGSWASSWIPPGAMGIPPRQDALEKCTRGNSMPERCVCQVVDENDANALEVPPEFAARAARR